MTATAPAHAVRRDDAHRYWTPDGREVIGVSRALKTAGLIDDRWFREQDTIRGTAVHQALEVMDGTTDNDPPRVVVNPDYHGYIYAYQKFTKECDLGPVVFNEQAFADPTLGFAGTVDRVRYVGSTLACIDIKTGLPLAWHRIQLAAYCHLVKLATHHAIVKRWGLYLRQDGSYSFIPYSDRADWDVFRACLLISQFQRRMAA